ncbi:hypothetical protein QVD17_21921 [Tagetes erecta]|uniref:Fe2OG dioxygenase domain-containing protein n=1 Tax=Tagetes erecta TaxID=13708 RepID=A0AAD8NTD4_TARER|nr:hypothetical protein QVD17_21921 [Tagetes erecta]
MSSLQQGHASLQELVKELKLVVPDHYIQEPQDLEPVCNSSLLKPSIPVIDMNDLIKMVEYNDIVQMKNLRAMCNEWGIFQLVNHGVDKVLVEKMKEEIVGFFNLPVEDKLRYKLVAGDYQGFGQTIVQTQDQKIDWADRFYMITNPVHRRKSHLLPQFPSTLRETTEKYLQEVQKLAMSLFCIFGQVLDIDKKEMIDVFDDGMQSIRMTYYPPCPQPDRVVGLTPHSDASGLTILLQVNEVGGLQVKKDGLWIPVDFLPDAFVVNIGDILEIMSNGVCNSIEHRATVNATKERISLAMFFNPKLEAQVRPAKSLLMKTKDHPLYRTLVMEHYLKEFFSHKLNGKAFLERMKIRDIEVQET